MSNPQPVANAELQQLTNTLTAAIKETSRQQSEIVSARLDRRIDELERSIERKVERLRDEIKEDMRDIRDEMASQTDKLDEHSSAIAEINARLKAGDDRMDRIEGGTDDTKEKNTQNRIDIVKVATQVGTIVGAGAAGGAAFGLMGH